MKFIRIYEGNAHGNPNLYEFHVGIEEIKLLEGLLKNFIANSPKNEVWKPENKRARNMIKAVKNILNRSYKKIK